jgi:hypothetical protein
MRRVISPERRNLNDLMRMQRDVFKQLYKTENKIFRHEKTQRELNKELQEIALVLPRLRDNYAALPDGELRDQTAERIAALELRQHTLSSRTPQYTEEYVAALRTYAEKQRILLKEIDADINAAKEKMGRK